MTIISGKQLNDMPNIAIVVSRFNEEITTALLDGALTRLRATGIKEEAITVAYVPGAIEIPVIAQRLAVTGQYAAIITLGAVIRGDTTHYDYVCQQVSHGCQQVALSTGIPVIFGILTTENEEQAIARAGGSEGNKGSYSADAALEMISVLTQIDEGHTSAFQMADLVPGLIGR